MKRKNILLLINDLQGGGAQKMTYNLSHSLSESYNVYVVIYNHIDATMFATAGQLIKIKLPYAENTDANSFLKRLIRFILLVRKLRKIKKQNKIDVSISLMEASNIINVLSSRKEKVILSVRSYLSHEFNDNPRLNIFRRVIKPLYNRSDKIVTPAQLMQTDLVTNFGIEEKKTRVIYNFIDNELIDSLKHEPLPAHIEAVFNNFPILINVGRINTPKAQWLLIPVIKEAKKKIPGIKLVILGEGPLATKLIQTASEAGLSVYVEGVTAKEEAHKNYDIYLLGFIKNLFPFLLKSHIFIKSSIYEGFPNVIIEAMACGLPIISSDCESGPREILEPNSSILHSSITQEYAEYGMLVPAYDERLKNKTAYITAATEVLKKLMEDPDTLNHYRKQSLIRSKDYAKSKIMEQWIKLIETN